MKQHLNKRTPRFRTKADFIRDFGYSYAKVVRSSWNSEGEMDYLFGKKVSTDLYIGVVTIGKRNIKIRDGSTSTRSSWTVTPDMLILSDNSVRRLLRAGKKHVQIQDKSRIQEGAWR